MKKILLLFASCFTLLPCFAQITISAPTSVTSGSTFTITAAGETSGRNVVNMFLFSSPPTTTDPANQYPVIENLDASGPPYSTSGQPTKFSTKITITSSSPVKVTFNVRFVVRTPSAQTNQDQTITITVNPAITTFYNVAKSGVFTRNNCGPGTTGTSVTYTIPANSYSASSQSAADQLAVNAVNAGGQAYANANGQCLIVYNSAEQTGMFTKNDCLTNGTPSAAVPYTKQAGAYTSTISQQDADGKAAAALLVDGQAYANANGTCTYPPYISGQQRTLKNMAHNYTVHNSLPGDVFSWAITDWNGYPTTIATILQGQGTSVLRIKLTNEEFDYYPVYFQLVLTITNPNSATRTVYHDIQLLDQIRP